MAMSDTGQAMDAESGKASCTQDNYYRVELVGPTHHWEIAIHDCHKVFLSTLNSAGGI